MLKIVCVEFEGLKQFENGSLRVDFFAADRVSKNSELFRVAGNVSVQNIIGFVGLNATGKTTALRLLKTALDIVIRNVDLNSAVSSNLIVDGTVIRTTFFFNGEYHQLESVIGVRDRDGNEFYYKREILKHKSASKSRSKNGLTDFASASGEARSELEKEAAKYLDESKSIVAPIIKGNNSYVTGNLWMNYLNVAVLSGKTPSEILDVFDDSIEEFSISKSPTDDRGEWQLKFKNDNTIYSGSDLLAPNLLISSGTISGQRLIRDAVQTLQRGGYLFVDELEAHLNKELVKVVLSLFGSKETNPNGACIIFSTHYAEILDFEILRRRDNIYVTRKSEGRMSARKLSEELDSKELKKSEVILSNLLKGTAPKYEAIERLREFVCSRVR